MKLIHAYFQTFNFNLSKFTKLSVLSLFDKMQHGDYMSWQKSLKISILFI